MSRRQLLRLIFHKDSLLLISSLVFSWFTVSLLVDSTLDIKDLVPHRGIITNIDSVVTKVINKPLFKEITQELRLTIDNEADYFTLISSEGFGDISSRIAVDDSITVFTKSKAWGIFGLTKKRNISQLLKNGEVIIAYSKYKQKISGFFVITGIAAVVFFIWYLNRTRTRYYFDIIDYR